MGDTWAVGKCECGKWLGFKLNDIRVLRFDQGPVTLGVCSVCARVHTFHHAVTKLVDDAALKRVLSGGRLYDPEQREAIANIERFRETF